MTDEWTKRQWNWLSGEKNSLQKALLKITILKKPFIETMESSIHKTLGFFEISKMCFASLKVFIWECSAKQYG